MTLIALENGTKGFNDRTLFEGVSFELGEGERVGLVGRNGSGKSSLLRILAGVDPPDEGVVTLRSGRRVGFLEQEPELDGQLSAREAVRKGLAGREKILAELATVHEQLGEVEGEAMEKLLARLERLEQRLEDSGGHDVEHRIEEALTSLDIPDPDAKCGPFSGGEKRRVALARLLVSRPDVLLLDEPTNHLDAFVTDWLEDWFLETRIPLVLVTHDRYLLERVCDRIVELDASKLWSYQGGYSDYLEQRAARLIAEQRAEAGRLAVLRRETAWIRRGPPRTDHEVQGPHPALRRPRGGRARATPRGPRIQPPPPGRAWVRGWSTSRASPSATASAPSSPPLTWSSGPACAWA